MNRISAAFLALAVLCPCAQARGGRPHPDLSGRSKEELMNILLSEPNPALRREAASQLGSEDLKGDEAVRGCLLKSFRSDLDQNVRAADLSALSRRGDPTIPPMLIAFLGDAANPMELRSQAAWSLGDAGSEAAIPALIAALDEQPLRFSAEHSLGQLKAAAAVEKLSEILMNDTDRSDKAEALEALGKIGDRRALPAVLSTLKDADQWNRRDAARSLSEIDVPDAAKPVLEALLGGDESAEVRIEAVFGLAKLGDVSALRGAFDNDPAYRVRSAAADELIQLRAPGGPFDAFQHIDERIKNGTWDNPGAPKKR